MTNALRPALPRAADGASAGVITPREFSRRKILGATTWLVRRIQVVTRNVTSGPGVMLPAQLLARIDIQNRLTGAYLV